MLNKIEHKYIVAAIYTCVLFLDRLDLTMVNIALPTLADYFHVPITHTEWISNAFLLALAISIPASAWIGDRFGLKKIFIFATGLFAFSALFCALTPYFTLLVIFRFLQGIGGGMLIPVGMTMLYRVFKPRDYASITSITFIVASIAPAMAPALGGAIIHFLNWKWIFIVTSSTCFFATAVAIFVLKKQALQPAKSFDWYGFLISACALIIALYTLSDFGRNGFSLVTSICTLVVICLLIAFIRYERVAPNPLIHLSLFENKLFVQSNLIQFAFQICHYASFFTIGIYLQVGVGMSAMFAGLMIGMQAIGAICTSRLSVGMFYRYGPGVTIMIGFFGVLIFSLAILYVRQPNLFYLGCLIMFCRGLFSGICGMPIQLTSVLGFEGVQISQASAVFNAGRQISITLGIALASFMISYGIKQQHGKMNLAVFDYAFYLILITSLIGIYLAGKIKNREAILKIKE